MGSPLQLDVVQTIDTMLARKISATNYIRVAREVGRSEISRKF